jgi:hypothetical protein
VDVEDIAWTPHGYKHFSSTKLSWGEVVRATARGPAKYLPEIDVEALERYVWRNGISATNGRTWKVMAFDGIIGASAGQESRWVRVEQNSNTIHGHPITQHEYERLIA